MNVKSFWIRCALIAALIFTSLSFAASPAYAFPPKALPNGSPATCNPPNCGPQGLGNGKSAVVNPLTVDFGFANLDQLFVSKTDIDSASSNPEDIVQLVDDAVTVWRSAFQDIPDIDLQVGWANFGVLDSINSKFLSGNLVGGIQKDCEDDDLNRGSLVPTELPAVSGDIIGLHISGTRSGKLTKYFQDQEPYSGDEAQASIILFNSELLKIREPGKPANSVKLFLDTDPFGSSAFDSIDTIGNPGHRLKRSFEFSDPYVVDLFTVALHEVGHALGYSEANGVLPGHIGKLDIPDVLSPYIPFATRKCPSTADIKGLVAAGPPIPISGSAGYKAVSDDPCGSIFERFDSKRYDHQRFNPEKIAPFLKKQPAGFELRKNRS